MKFQNLSVKRLFGRVAIGLVLSMSGITIAPVSYTHLKGYPDDLKAESISYFARITTISDIYDAMLSEMCIRDSYCTADRTAVILRLSS